MVLMIILAALNDSQWQRIFLAGAKCVQLYSIVQMKSWTKEE